MRSRQAGMSLIEASIILSVIATLAAVLAPSINGYVEQARRTRAMADTQVIAEAIQQFIEDNAIHYFLQFGRGVFPEDPPAQDSNRVDLLVSDGDIPALGSAVSTETYWTQATNNSTVDTLANHLVQNTPGDDCAGCPGEFGDTAYRNPADLAVGGFGFTNTDFARFESGGFNAPYAWRGAYLRGPVRADPWGNRYAVNVAFLKAGDDAAVSGITSPFDGDPSQYPRLDVFVLSAGVDEEIDTRSAQDGAVPGDDDVIFIVSSHAK